MTDCEQERNLLTSIRYGATVISYTLVFALTGLLLGFDQDANSRIGPNDATGQDLKKTVFRVAFKNVEKGASIHSK